MHKMAIEFGLAV